MNDPRRRIPAVDQLLGAPAIETLASVWGRGRVTEGIRAVQDGVRAALNAGRAVAGDPDDPEWYAREIGARLEAESRPVLARVLNATGVILHTNLGRAPLASAARHAIAAAAGYAALEVDLETGGRGSRGDHCVHLLRELTGAEGALVVNNNAAAVVLAVNTIAAGREVIVSRGELVEIGGSFRVPEIVERSGARLREVGATNRTHARDFREALRPETGAILRVHRSNFRVEGFVAEVPSRELASIAAEAGVPLIDDLGSGLLVDLAPLGFGHEPTVRQALAAGADLVTMSGDKLLGGPQAGIILGRESLIARLRSNPLNRALRPDKLTLAALEATLQLYRDPGHAFRDVPTLAMLGADPVLLRRRAEAMAESLRKEGVKALVLEGASAIGGGALPGADLPTSVVAVEPRDTGADALARQLRTGHPAVVGRVKDGRLLLDPRTLLDGEDDEVVREVIAAVNSGS